MSAGTPHSLFVRDRDSLPLVDSTSDESPVIAGPSTHLPDEVEFLVETRAYKRALEKELEAWMDFLTESESVDTRTLKRSSLYLTTTDYEEIEHERHLASLCSYPCCSHPCSRPFTSQSHYTFRSTGIISLSQTSKSRDLVVQDQGNKDDGFCSKDCLIRSRWFEKRLRDDAIWTRPLVAPGDLGRWKSRARGGGPDEERAKAALEVEVLEDLEQRGEVTLQDGNLYVKGALPPGASSAVTTTATPPTRLAGSSPLDHDDTGRSQSTTTTTSFRPQLPLNGLKKTGLVAETRQHPSAFEDQLNATLAALSVVERPGKSFSHENDTSTAETTTKKSSKVHDKQQTLSVHDESCETNHVVTPAKMQPHSVAELLPESQQRPLSGRPTSPSRTESWSQDQHEEDEEDDETRDAFEAAYAARDMLRNGTFN